MGKKKYRPKPSQQFIAVLPWHIDTKGNKYIDIGNNTFITPDTNLTNEIEIQVKSQVQANDITFTLDDNGLCFYGNVDQSVLIQPHHSSSSFITLNEPNEDK